MRAMCQSLRLLTLAVLIPRVLSSDDYHKCLDRIKNGTYGLTGGLDTSGKPVADIRNATAITYSLCRVACSDNSASLDPTVFSQQLGTWTLPWIALTSILPYGSKSNFVNFESVYLTMGSPVLAAYTLTLTTLNSRWAIRHMQVHKDSPNAAKVGMVLAMLQQVPLTIDYYSPELPAWLTTDTWWDNFYVSLNRSQPHPWGISAATSIAWVVIAYVVTVVVSFAGELHSSFKGQCIGILWVWLLPVVVCYLRLAPKCDPQRILDALNRADERFILPGTSDVQEEAAQSPLSIVSYRDSLRSDENHSPPIYNYARVFAWGCTVNRLACALSSSGPQYHTEDEPLRSPLSRESIELSKLDSEDLEAGPILHCNRTFMRVGSLWCPGIWKRVALASVLAIFLQWMTTAGAVIAAWFTPTIGLGCRSLSFIIYGGLSTIIWLMFLLSSILSHHASSESSTFHFGFVRHVERLVSIMLRRAAKIAAAVNAMALIAICVFQFSPVFDNCYCNSSVTWWGNRAYQVIDPSGSDIVRMKHGWLAGQLLAAGAAFLFIFTLNRFMNHTSSQAIVPNSNRGATGTNSVYTPELNQHR